MIIREYNYDDLPQIIEIWNEIVLDGNAFPQEDILDLKSASEFFSSQSFTGIAIEDNIVYGVYILHPNNIGRCGHIANSSYAVSSRFRGKSIGKKLVLDSIEQAKQLGFLILQFNAVVESNSAARKLYESVGFKQLGTIPNGFKMKDGHYENICPYYIEL